MEAKQLKAVIIILAVFILGTVSSICIDIAIGYEYVGSMTRQGIHDLVQKLQGGALTLAWLAMLKAFRRKKEEAGG